MTTEITTTTTTTTNVAHVRGAAHYVWATYLTSKPRAWIDEVLDVWVDLLGDLPATLVAAAVRDLCRVSPTAPSPQQIRAQALSVIAAEQAADVEDESDDCPLCGGYGRVWLQTTTEASGDAVDHHTIAGACDCPVGLSAARDYLCPWRQAVAWLQSQGHTIDRIGEGETPLFIPEKLQIPASRLGFMELSLGRYEVWMLSRSAQNTLI